MAVQMTRAEYEAKYGVAPVVGSSSVDTTVSIPKMTRAEYEAKYGAPAVEPQKTGVFGSPSETIQSAGAQVLDAITGAGQYAGKSSLERGFSAAGTAAMAVPTVVADVIPGGKALMDFVGKGFEKGINFAASVPDRLDDIALKAGILSPEVKAWKDQAGGEFANSPTGIAIESAANILKSSGDVANTILMADSVAKGTQSFIDNKVPAIKEKVAETVQSYKESQNAKLVDATAEQIAAVENKYVKGRKANKYSEEGGFPSQQRIAQSGVLKYAVDESGLIRTQNPGGALDQYKAMTVKPVEGVVRANLVREGGKTNLSDVQAMLESEIRGSSLEGADLVNALNGVKKEIAGLRMKADDLGYVKNEVLHDAKINTTNNINYQTPPETATYRKSVARAYRQLVEDNAGFNVKEINAELAKYYEDIARLERLDGARVEGGKLGKYTAQLSGNIIGGAFGSMLGAPGAAIGSIIGGEVSALMKGKSMAGTFSKSPEGGVPKNPILEKALEMSKMPPQENNLGNRNTTYQTPNKSNSAVIPDTVAQTASKEAFHQVRTQMLELSKAGRRVITESGNVIGESSTFPKWVPSYLRDATLFKQVWDMIDEGKMPKAGATRQLELYDVIQKQIEQRAVQLQTELETPSTRGTPDDVFDAMLSPDEVRQITEEGIGITSDSSILETIKESSLKLKVDYGQPFSHDGQIANVFGHNLALSAFEARTLKEHGIEFRSGVQRTTAGRKKAKQSLAGFTRLPDGTSYIRFNPEKTRTVGEVIQTFYHELGHAVDIKNGDLRHRGWNLPPKEKYELALERFGRNAKDTIDKYKLSEQQVKEWFDGGKVSVGPGVYIATPKSYVRYVKDPIEIFAEAYAMLKLNPGKLKKLSPVTYEFLSKITK